MHVTKGKTDRKGGSPHVVVAGPGNGRPQFIHAPIVLPAACSAAQGVVALESAKQGRLSLLELSCSDAIRGHVSLHGDVDLISQEAPEVVGAACTAHTATNYSYLLYRCTGVHRPKNSEQPKQLPHLTVNPKQRGHPCIPCFVPLVTQLA
jgi:hypothetical protein